ncbi:rhomboid family intramembrane serine protease [Seongchinamella sediminis]|uniref:Rhomboid family intramembrane serine protease n=1 Tax=Seongchinamella sediminis TaxID=2283635 RepID=A0A3L7DXT7_9GAMM|nr:rhomboid family intramembrane serine protease [Seongchinamella sediminis]RLQ22408.1 rhomboid family intramembrane serine protease [Seongchinamella sediminis]
MADSYIVLQVPLEEDLLPLTALLRRRGVPHRIYEEEGQQVLAVFDRQHVQPVASLYQAWRRGQVTIEPGDPRPVAASASRFQWRQSPVTALFGLVSIVLFLALLLGAPQQWLGWLTFTPFEIRAGQLHFLPMGDQYWRLVTPIFLHFGWLHITFNTLWLWELGSKVERVTGSPNTLGLLLVIALVSNICQYQFGGPGLFGGMSGVVYGLLGFSWVAPLVQPRWVIQPARAIMLLMVGWLFLCLFGVVEFLGFGAIANAAHLGGLVVGLALGAAFGLLSRLQDSGRQGL